MSDEFAPRRTAGEEAPADVPVIPAVERDRELLNAWREGDHGRGAELMEHYRRFFLSLCWRYGVRDHDERLELYQELLLRLLRALPKVELQSSFAGYLRRVFHTTYRRTRSRSVSELKEEAVAGTEDGMRPVEQQELRAVIEECQEGLESREAYVFHRRLHEEAPYQEISETLGLTLGNLHVIYHRARTKMQQCLKKKGFEV